MPLFRLPAFAAIAIMSIGLGIAADPVCARPITEEEVEVLVPDKDRDGEQIHRYRWSNKTRIDVIVITDNQNAACVSAAVKQIRKQVDLLRREIPSLRIAENVQVMDSAPDTYQPSMLLIALPTDDDRVATTLEAFARKSVPNATFVGEPVGHGMSHGVGRRDDPPDIEPPNSFNSASIRAIEDGYVVEAYGWELNKRGIEYLTGRCGWSWGDSLLQLLGADYLDFYTVRDWQELFPFDTRQKAEFAQRIRRAFLRALYEHRDATVDMNAVRHRFRELLNDPKFPGGPDDASK
jgi:hypothetical protein